MDQELHWAILLWCYFFWKFYEVGIIYSSKRLSGLLYLGLEPSLIARVLFSLVQFISVTQLCPTLRPHGLQRARSPCPSPAPGTCSDSHPSGQLCHPAILSAVLPFSSCLQSFPASWSFLMRQFFTSGGQRIGVAASVLPMNIQDWCPVGLTGLISLQSKGLSRMLSNTTVQKHQFFSAQLSLWSNYHIHTWLLENHREMGEGNRIEMGKCLAFDKNIP